MEWKTGDLASQIHFGPGFKRWFERNSSEHTTQKTDVEQPHSPGFVVYSIVASPKKRIETGQNVF